ncbi:cytochrome c biogenesis protein CcdA [Candidatus Poriferisodalis sp.]|uniref:cytochrome c biogenesis protein CcdA n=1 Tax=Candidatus Poriferisodalis sp. TaxID=3101277 RepID=UPI003C6ED151
MGTLIDTLTEGIGVITWACTLTVLAPGVALVLVARQARLTVALYYVVGAALLAWAPAAGHWSVSARGAAVVIAGLLAAGTYVAAWRAQSHSSPYATGAGIVGGALAGWLWRPCVGPRLGDILNEASTDELRTLALMGVYVAGALLPLLLLAVLPYAVLAVDRVLDRIPFAIAGAVIGAAYAITLAIGLYDDLIGELYRISAGY